MRAGQLRHRITIQAPQVGTDAWGQPVTTWREAVSVWADIRPVSVREKMRGGALESEITHTILVRWQSLFAVPTTLDSWRIVFFSRMFRVTGGYSPAERREAFIFTCVEIAGLMWILDGAAWDDNGMWADTAQWTD